MRVLIYDTNAAVIFWVECGALKLLDFDERPLLLTAKNMPRPFPTVLHGIVSSDKLGK